MRDLLSGLDHFDVHGGYLVSAGSRGEYVRVDDVRESLRSDETRRKITEVLAQNGVQPNTDAMHSWRCNEPERYPNYCTCVPELLGDLIEALAGGDDA